MPTWSLIKLLNYTCRRMEHIYGTKHHIWFNNIWLSSNPSMIFHSSTSIKISVHCLSQNSWGNPRNIELTWNNIKDTVRITNVSKHTYSIVLSYVNVRHSANEVFLKLNKTIYGRIFCSIRPKYFINKFKCLITKNSILICRWRIKLTLG